MSNNLFANLGDQHDLHSGVMSGQIDAAGGSIAPRTHYDIRSFHGDDITVPRTMRDFDYWNADSFNGTQIQVLDAPRIVSGRSVAARPIATINGLLLEELNEMEMADLDLDTVVAGNEGWTGTSITVGKDATLKYANTIEVPLTSGVDKTVTSAFRDNLIADFDAPQNYFIELALPAFPAQAAGTHLDLANSYIDFTSSASYAAGQTDTFRFDQSLNSLTGGGDTYWQINRNNLVNVTLANITGIRFRLRSVGNMTFKAAAMRLIPASYTWDGIDIDTKRGKLAKSFPRNGGTEIFPPNNIGGTGDYARLFYPSRPKNVRMIAKFNSGHLPTAPNVNTLHLIARHDPAQNDRVAILMRSNATNTELELRETKLGVGTVLNFPTGAALTAEKDYFLILDVNENKVTARIVAAFGAFMGATHMTTTVATTTLGERGYIGYRFAPYNYDFTVDYFTVEDTQFARYESAPFISLSPVKAVTISSHESQALDLAQERYIPAGDATVSSDPTFGTNAPSKKFERSGLVWQGGYITDDFIYVGSSKNLRITGDIFPALATGQTSLRGEYRVVFLDKNDSVAYIGQIRNLLPSQWNQFDIHINATFAPGNYKVIIQQTGFYADTFWIDNLKLEHQQIAWEVSPDEGVTWYPALFAKDKLYSAVNFIDNANSSIKLRASALSESAWVADYEVIPHYGYPGRMT